ncbi:MAG TPA: hypothetical protein VFJ20_01635 [Gemmatimonadaceae bacterium]|nr:hypothetical protein [Gemmatimonadaceae bacterium]
MTSPASRVPSDAAPAHASRPAPRVVRDTRPPLAAQRWPVLVILTTLALVNVAGFPYYRLPLGERVRSPLHVWLRPSGVVGQSAGILALLIFFFLWLYPLRKKYRSLAFTGTVARWLDIHILAAIGLPLLVAVHASWRFDGLVGLGYFAMLVVCASGIVGRYLYVRIPRSRSGVASTREEVALERRTLITDIAAATGLDPFVVERTLSVSGSSGSTGIARTLLHLLSDDITRWRLTRALRRQLADARGSAGQELDRDTLDRVVELASREISLAQQLRMLDATKRVFGYWHVAHRPFAVTALVAVLIHVAVVVAVGATWFW